MTQIDVLANPRSLLIHVINGGALRHRGATSWMKRHSDVKPVPTGIDRSAGRYYVEIAGSARLDLRRLSSKIAAAIIEFVTGTLAENARRLSKVLRGELAAYRSARRGDYGVLFRIDDDKHTIVIVAVNHRAHSYRPR